MRQYIKRVYDEIRFLLYMHRSYGGFGYEMYLVEEVTTERLGRRLTRAEKIQAWVSVRWGFLMTIVRIILRKEED